MGKQKINTTLNEKKRGIARKRTNEIDESNLSNKEFKVTVR